jgi:hypothetical protein
MKSSHVGLTPIIHGFSGRLEKSKEFLTEATETMHRDHGEISEMFSVHSVVKEFKATDALITL